MAEILGWAPDVWLNTTTSSESTEVTQEDLVRVSESMKQAALIGWQIRWNQQQNRQLADFLQFLLDEVKDDTVREWIIQLCTVPDSTGKNMTLALEDLVAFFVPFFQQEAEDKWVFVLFKEIPHVDALDSAKYVSYIQWLMGILPVMSKMNKADLERTINSILHYFGYADQNTKITLW